MMILNHFTLILLIACIFVAECEKGQGRKGKGDRAKLKEGGNKNAPPGKPSASPRGNDKSQKSRGGKEAFRGKFSTKDVLCTWAANGEDKFTLGVSCKKGGESFNCQYTATPAVCPEYATKFKVYWKQIGRALKKQKTLCQDTNAIIKAAVCKKATKDAHFRLDRTPPPAETAVSTKDNKTCAENADNAKLAEEYCGGSWSSLCTFFFSMVQNGEC